MVLITPGSWVRAPVWPTFWFFCCCQDNMTILRHWTQIDQDRPAYAPFAPPPNSLLRHSVKDYNSYHFACDYLGSWVSLRISMRVDASASVHFFIIPAWTMLQGAYSLYQTFSTVLILKAWSIPLKMTCGGMNFVELRSSLLIMSVVTDAWNVSSWWEVQHPATANYTIWLSSIASQWHGGVLHMWYKSHIVCSR